MGKNMEREKTIVITGCSSGIGYGLLKKFTAEGYHVFGSVRKQKDADKLKREIGDLYTPLIFDVTNTKAVHNSVKIVSKQLNGKGLGGLINNAGTVSIGPVFHMDTDEVKYLFEVNTFGPLEVMKAYLPLLGMAKNHNSAPGRIINISSASGQLAVPFLGGYTGAKHALEGISNCLRPELKKYGIDIIIIGPGFVNTSIGGRLTNIKPFKNTEYYKSLQKFSDTTLVQLEKEGHTIEEQASIIFKIFTAKNPKIRYSTARNKFKNWTLLKMMPNSIREKLVAGIFGLNK